ncbi:predicted protein [Nematostella vectensis]|uniref:TMC domain-containing protein n=1 Tax=Nematostella vectensis TaxID=45351 RepID=A7RJT8_NEMVE|nr:predicted protein [Nematostella vectensis]|eukprot:XP_001640393.1 predicted protein [Nematostella vectensis]
MSLEMQSVGEDPYSVDPYAVNQDDGVEPTRLPSRAIGTRHGSVRRRSGRRTVRRGSNALTTMQVVEMDDGEDEEDFQEVKAVAAPMQQKREMKKNQTAGQKIRRISCWKATKLKIAMGWHRLTGRIGDALRDLELWKGSMKEIEGRFGNGVLSYFVFLKWLMFVNLFIFLLTFGFTSVPALVSEPVAAPNNTNSCTYSTDTYTDKSPPDLVLDFITGVGWINTTLLFYSSYPSETIKSVLGHTYNLPLAYLLVGGAYFFFSLLLMVNNLTKSFQESYIEGGGTFYSYCNKAFASWDYCIDDENTARVKSQNIVQDIKAGLAEEARLEKVRNRTRGQKCRLYTIRATCTLLVMGLLGGAVYAIYLAVEVSTDPKVQEGKSAFMVILIRSASSLTITGLNLLLPPFFILVSNFEDWSPRFQVNISLWRTVLLRLASIAVLIITLYVDVGKKCDDGEKSCCQNSWENQIASQMYMLIWIDFFVVIATTLGMETILRLLFKHTRLFRKLNVMPEFQIPKNVLDLVYGQCLLWIGTFFSPAIPAMGVVKLFIVFYVKKLSLMYNNKPSDQPYQGARSNYLFTVLLLITFFTCLIAVGWGITRWVTLYTLGVGWGITR